MSTTPIMAALNAAIASQIGGSFVPVSASPGVDASAAGGTGVGVGVTGGRHRPAGDDVTPMLLVQALSVPEVPAPAVSSRQSVFRLP